MAIITDELGNIISSTPDENELGGTSADGDKSYDKAELAKLARQGQVAQEKTSSNTAAANAGTTVAGQSDTDIAKKARLESPGRRTSNPLSKFSSSTYQITLYMITPDAYTAFIESGRRNINALSVNTPGSGGNGAYVIAQSGGVNNNSNKRAPGFDLDYYIDDLRIKTYLTGKDTKGAVVSTEVNFTISEPYGFSFISKLAIAKKELEKTSRSDNYKNLNPSRQFFILGIRFQGYDKDGKVMTGKEVFANDTFDPNGNSDGIFERFYDIMITGMKFKLGASMTTYQVTANTVGPQTTYTSKRGLIKNGAKVIASTVKEALTGVDGLLTKLNKDQQDLLTKVDSISKPTKYSVIFLGDAEQDIGGASVLSKADLDKSKLPMSNFITKTSQSNPAYEVENLPNINKKQIQFRAGEPVLQAINQLIAQSTYLQNALIAVEKSELEPDPKDPKEGQIDTGSKRRIKWYNISSQVKPLGFDNKINDFAYDITYIIQPYETPVIVSTYANKTTRYYGPHKRYEYLYTGQNSEIISYEQSLNNNYVTTIVNQPNDGKAASGGTAGIPAIPDMFTPNTPRDGRLPGGMEAENNYLTNLTDPQSWAAAKIQILGDPDYLMQDTSTGLNAVYSKFYGSDGFTINPMGGQVFIEIDFKEPVDYKNSTGTMTINDSITFGSYPPDIKAQLKGVSYQVLTCTSMFKQGKFIQELGLQINTFNSGDLDTGKKAGSNSGLTNGNSNQSQAETNRLARQNQNAANATTTPDYETTDPMGASDSSAIMNAAGTGVKRTIPTTSGVTVDDDANPQVGQGPNIPI